jgi:isopentenyl phosphate kinase
MNMKHEEMNMMNSKASTTDLSREVVLVKLGGSLITDKESPQTPRREVIERLAGELARGREKLAGSLIVGHGSGSFGHVLAAEYRLQEGIRGPEQLAGIGRTQAEAARLHLLVVDALNRAGAAPFSISPSSVVVAIEGRPVEFQMEPLILAEQSGLLPVVYGDVILDRKQGVSICSTETVLFALAEGLLARGVRIARMLWVGATDGIYDEHGETIPLVSEENFAQVQRQVREPVGTDVTGGMLHRLRTAQALSRLGITSWILNGLHPGVLEDALGGAEVLRTEVMAGN